MASLSLPRVLQLKKNSVDSERENFEKFQSLAINKAINSQEIPVKEKHVRSTIIGTFQEQGAVTFWVVASRLPLQDNRIVAWKFCNVLHKILREGHPASIDDSQRHIGMIENIGKLWMHLREGYGRLIQLYCNVLITKLKFHARNPRFPSNLALTGDELDAITETDVNNYFQLCVELFDYMDDILNLQVAVFESLGNARANSMTASGQCRLAALIPCAQDSSCIYDCNVRLLFRLHAALPNDTLIGHRDRFRDQFKKLSHFYKHAGTMQYYRNLLTLPQLPQNQPNFLIQSDFGTYVPPVVSVPEIIHDDQDTVGSLIDTSDTISQMSSASPESQDVLDNRLSPPPPHQQPLHTDIIVERDSLIAHLQTELKRLRDEMSHMATEKSSILSSMRDYCTKLELELKKTETELEVQQQKAAELSSVTPEITNKLAETEKKARTTEEKFNKLKSAYTQLREEHITLLRQKAELDKSAAALRAAAAEHESAKVTLQQRLNDKMRDMEILQQSASSSESATAELEALRSELTTLRTDLTESKQKEVELQHTIEELKSQHMSYENEVTDKLKKTESLLNEMKSNNEALEKQIEEKNIEIEKSKDLLKEQENEAKEEVRTLKAEKEALLLRIEAIKDEQERERQEHLNMLHQFENTFSSFDVIKDNEDVENIGAVERQEKTSTPVKTAEDNSDEEHKINENIRMKKFEHFEAQMKKLLSEKMELANLVQQVTSENKEQHDKIKELEESLKLSDSQSEAKESEYINNIQSLDMEVNMLNEELEEIREIFSEYECTFESPDGEWECVSTKDSVITGSTVIQKLKSVLNERSQLLGEVQDLKTKIKVLTENVDSLEDTLQSLEIQYKIKESEHNKKISLANSEAEALRHELSEISDVMNEQEAQFEIAYGELNKMEKEQESNENMKHKEVTSLKMEMKRILNEKMESVNKLKEYIDKDKEQSEKMQCLQDDLDALEIQYTIKESESNKMINVLKSQVEILTEELKDIRDYMAEQEAQFEIATGEIVKLEEEQTHFESAQQNEVFQLKKDMKRLIDEKLQLSSNFIVFKKEKEALIQTCENLKTDLKKLEADIDKKNAILITKNEEIIKLNHELTNIRVNYDTSCAKVKDLEKALSEIKVGELVNTNKALLDAQKENEMLDDRYVHSEEMRLKAECDLQDLLQQNTDLESQLTQAQHSMKNQQNELEELRNLIVKSSANVALEILSNAHKDLERSGVESVVSLSQIAGKSLRQLSTTNEIKGNEKDVAKSVMSVAHSAAQINARTAELSSAFTDTEKAEKFSSSCKTMLETSQKAVESISRGILDPTLSTEAHKNFENIEKEVISAGPGDRHNSVDDELADMDRAIEEAAGKMAEILAASRSTDTGVKLEVNEKILDACTTLMAAVQTLVREARKLQNEIGDKKQRANMYRRNPQWSEGLISAAKAVVFAAKLLLTSADAAVKGEGSFEAVAAASHEVATATAQLVAASRSKAPPNATAALSSASRHVAHAAGVLLAAVRAASSLISDREELDTSSLSLTATRRLEMESKVRALELETELERERSRLAALRRHHYQLAMTQETGKSIEESQQ